MSTKKDSPKGRRILFVCSPGGHYAQAQAIASSLSDFEIFWASPQVTTSEKCFCINDCSLQTPVKLILVSLQIIFILFKTKPNLIISTGAAPGAIAIVIAKIINSKSIWIDSIANSVIPSTSGRLVRKWADIWISQWESVAKEYGGVYVGQVFDIFDGGDTVTVRSASPYGD